MKRYSLFVDFDDTIIRSKHLVILYLNKKYNVELGVNDLSDNDSFDKILNKNGIKIDRNETYLDFGKNFFPSLRVEEISLFPGAKEAIENLSTIYNMYIVTSRQDTEKVFIEDILKHNDLFKYFQETHCVWKWKNNHFVKDSKVSFIKRQPSIPVSFIDDSLKEVISASRESICSALFDPCCTQKGESIGYEVYNSWEKINKIFS